MLHLAVVDDGHSPEPAVRVLPKWRFKADPIHLVYPGQIFVAPKLRGFIDLAAEVFEQLLTPDSP